MNDYLNGTETFARENPNVFHPDSLTMNGIDTYPEFDELIDYAIQNNYKNLRRSDMYCLYEHKKVMFDRVVYLNEIDFLKASSELIEEFESIKKQAQILMLLGLKVNTLNESERKNSTLLVIKEKLHVLKQVEESAWYKYIDMNREVLG